MDSHRIQFPADASNQIGLEIDHIRFAAHAIDQMSKDPILKSGASDILNSLLRLEECFMAFEHTALTLYPSFSRDTLILPRHLIARLDGEV